jgi:N-methylhydantoinase A/oxoprolinase/acetone carboxylase beta subunit
MRSPHARAWVGIDIGGTFSDVVTLDDRGQVISAFKVPSTPDDPAEAVFAGLARLEDRLPGLADGRLPIAVFHGTTAATNALIQKRGAKTALLTTDGCRDVLELRRQARPELYRLFQRILPPLVERRWRLEIAERVASDGSVVRLLERDSVQEAVEVLQEGEIEALAICFLHAYANDEHERSVGRIIEEELPHVDLSLSSDVCPEIGEFERTSTVVVNAYVSPEVRRYLRRLREGMSRYGVDRFHVVKSNWAQPLDTPPFYVFAVTCGITFTFGGVRIDEAARVLDRAGRPIKGLHAAGELVGGLFYHNYPGGSGLTSGAVFGRRAGATAATHAGARTPGFRNLAQENSR